MFLASTSRPINSSHANDTVHRLKLTSPDLHDALQRPDPAPPGSIEPRGSGGNDAAPPDDSWLEVQAATAFGGLWWPRASLWDRRGKCMDGGRRCQHAPFSGPRKSVFCQNLSDSEGIFPSMAIIRGDVSHPWCGANDSYGGTGFPYRCDWLPPGNDSDSPARPCSGRQLWIHRLPGYPGFQPHRRR